MFRKWNITPAPGAVNELSIGGFAGINAPREGPPDWVSASQSNWLAGRIPSGRNSG
jgi:hypothetical protein